MNVLAFAIASLFLLVPTLYYPLLAINKLGLAEEASLIDTIVRLFDGSFIIALILFFMVVLAPLIMIFCALVLVIKDKADEPQCPFYRSYFFAKRWMMLDVLTVAVFASMIKLSELVSAEILVGTAFCFITWVSLSIMDANMWFEEIEIYTPSTNLKTIVLSLSALSLLIPSNLLAIMTMIKPGGVSTTNLWESIMHLFEGETWPIGIVVFLASFCGPWFKIISLLYLAITNKSNKPSPFKTGLYHFLEAVGRWSMIDIFIAAILVAIVKLNKLASVSLEDGSLVFTAMVMLTLFASNSFTFKGSDHK